jgi:predicted N-acetyltransferase YhbS
MNNFLHLEAYAAHIEREASTTLVFHNQILVAYFTLHRVPIQINADKKEALSLARLAVDKKYQRKGIGAFIIDKIKKISYMTNERYIHTDALYEKWQWYSKQGFAVAIEDEVKNKNDFIYMILDLYDEDIIKRYYDDCPV